MAAYFPGCPVRHVGQNGPYFNPMANQMIGMTGRLLSRLDIPGWWYVVMDGGLYDLEAHESSLEPIVPTGQAAGESGLCDPLDRLLGRVTA